MMNLNQINRLSYSSSGNEVALPSKTQSLNFSLIEKSNKNDVSNSFPYYNDNFSQEINDVHDILSNE